MIFELTNAFRYKWYWFSMSQNSDQHCITILHLITRAEAIKYIWDLQNWRSLKSVLVMWCDNDLWSSRLFCRFCLISRFSDWIYYLFYGNCLYCDGTFCSSIYVETLAFSNSSVVFSRQIRDMVTISQIICRLRRISVRLVSSLRNSPNTFVQIGLRHTQTHTHAHTILFDLCRQHDFPSRNWWKCVQQRDNWYPRYSISHANWTALLFSQVGVSELPSLSSDLIHVEFMADCRKEIKLIWMVGWVMQANAFFQFHSIVLTYTTCRFN